MCIWEGWSRAKSSFSFSSALAREAVSYGSVASVPMLYVVMRVSLAAIRLVATRNGTLFDRTRTLPSRCHRIIGGARRGDANRRSLPPSSIVILFTATWSTPGSGSNKGIDGPAGSMRQKDTQQARRDSSRRSTALGPLPSCVVCLQASLTSRSHPAAVALP